MNKILAIVMLLITFSIQAEKLECPALYEQYRIERDQEIVMKRSYEAGRLEGYGYTLAAIAFYESSAGRNMSNPNDPSGGVFHITLKNVMAKFGMKDTEENRAQALDMLNSNFDFSVYMAIDVLDWWSIRHDGDKFNAIRSYNGGYYWWSDRESEGKRSMTYATNINEMKSFLRLNCGWGIK